MEHKNRNKVIIVLLVAPTVQILQFGLLFPLWITQNQIYLVNTDLYGISWPRLRGVRTDNYRLGEQPRYSNLCHSLGWNHRAWTWLTLTDKTHILVGDNRRSSTTLVK